jgi:TolB protein
MEFRSRLRWFGRASLITALLAACGDPSGPSPVPPGLIAFTAFGSRRDYDILTVASSGRGAQPLIARSVADAFPAWSPNGNAVAFLSRGLSSVPEWDVSIATRTGSGVHSVLISGADGSPTWSPDGSQLAFTCPDSTPQWQLCVVGVDGSDKRQLTPAGSNCFADAPAWSPSGGRLAYACFGSGVPGVRLIDDDGSNDHVLTSEIIDIRSVAWSPDAKRLAVIGTRVSGVVGVLELLLLEADGSNLVTVPVAVRPYQGVAWSPDGRWLAYGGGELSHTRIYVTALDGSALRAITPDTLQATDPSWSPLPR